MTNNDKKFKKYEKFIEKNINVKHDKEVAGECLELLKAFYKQLLKDNTRSKYPSYYEYFTNGYIRYLRVSGKLNSFPYKEYREYCEYKAKTNKISMMLFEIYNNNID